jgi:hypothetical protein
MMAVHGEKPMGGGPTNPSSGTGACPTGSTAACGTPPPDEKVYDIKLVPRSKAGVSFKSPPQLDATYLPEFKSADCPIGPPNAFKSLETRFYIDLATKPSLIAKRKITAVVTENGKPASGKQVKWERVDGSANLKFEKATTPVDKGLAEATITHVVEQVDPVDRHINIRATIVGTPSPVQATLSLTITRNDDVSSLDEVMADAAKEGEADAILVYQPTAGVQSSAVGTPVDDAAKTLDLFDGLQHILNQVVSRHKGIGGFSFLYQDGIYGDGTKKAVKQFITGFTNIRGGDWQCDLKDIGVYKSLKDYVNKEYKPFTYEEGLIVDRHLLIGTKKDVTPANIDGLWELKTGVVDKLVPGMRAKADEYLNCDTFWLHRDIHHPYQKGDEVGAVVTQQVVTVMDSAGGTPLTDATGASVTLPKANRSACLGNDKDATGHTWYNVRLSATQDGWVPKSSVKAIEDDRNKDDCNSGLFGGNGVAYSFGCKETPAEFTAQLTANSPVPADIINWVEYTKGHKPGLTQSEQTTGGTENGHERDWTGIDCSGFCQHCVTAAVFPDGTRIVPDSILTALTDRGRPGDKQVGASAAVGNYARKVPYKKTDAHKLWIRGGDIVATSGHIVWVVDGPDDAPDALNDNRDFEVYNAHGGVGTAAVQATQFVHKTIRMPFNWWGVKLSGADVTIGRVYIWK